MNQIFYFDLETHLFGPGNMDPKPVCMSFVMGENLRPAKPHLVLAHQIEGILGPVLEEAIKNRTIVLAGHGVAYDFCVLRRWFPRLERLIWRAYDLDLITDTLCREHLLDIAKGELRGGYHKGQWREYRYGLGDICERRLGVKLDKGSDSYRKRYGELDGLPLEQWPHMAKSYALDDSGEGYNLLVNQGERARRLRYDMPTQWDDARADFALRLITNHGLLTDKDRVETLHAHTIREMRRLGDILCAEGLARWKSMGRQGNLWGEPDEKKLHVLSKRVQQRVLDTYPGEPPATKTGQISTTKDTKLICHDDGLFASIQFDALRKQGSTYVKRLFDGTGQPLHPSFGATGADSNRTRSWNPNMQNQPRIPGVRECFRPRDGFVFAAVDYNTQEMRTWAQTCLDLLGGSRLASEYQRDPTFDPHQLFADEYFPGLQGGRQRAKAANFGFPGGLGWKGFMGYAKGYGVNLSQEEAEDVKRGWEATWPEQRRYFAYIRSCLDRGGFGTITDPATGFRRGNVTYTSGANNFFQHRAAACSKRGAWLVARACYDPGITGSPLRGCYPVNFIHDELVAEVPEDAGHEPATAISQLMVSAMAQFCPDVPSLADPALGAVWSKECKQIRDAHGRLQVWRPEWMAA